MEVGGLSEFTNKLEENLMQLGCDLTKFSLEYAEEIIFNVKERKNQFESLEKDDRKVISIFGEIDFKRRYYLDKQTNKRVYLLDEYFKDYQKMLKQDQLKKQQKQTTKKQEKKQPIKQKYQSKQ